MGNSYFISIYKMLAEVPEHGKILNHKLSEGDEDTCDELTIREDFSHHVHQSCSNLIQPTMGNESVFDDDDISYREAFNTFCNTLTHDESMNQFESQAQSGIR